METNLALNLSAIFRIQYVQFVAIGKLNFVNKSCMEQDTSKTVCDIINTDSIQHLLNVILHIAYSQNLIFQ